MLKRHQKMEEKKNKDPLKPEEDVKIKGKDKNFLKI